MTVDGWGVVVDCVDVRLVVTDVGGGGVVRLVTGGVVDVTCVVDVVTSVVV